MGRSSATGVNSGWSAAGGRPVKLGAILFDPQHPVGQHFGQLGAKLAHELLRVAAGSRAGAPGRDADDDGERTIVLGGNIKQVRPGAPAAQARVRLSIGTRTWIVEVDRRLDEL